MSMQLHTPAVFFNVSVSRSWAELAHVSVNQLPRLSPLKPFALALDRLQAGVDTMATNC